MLEQLWIDDLAEKNRITLRKTCFVHHESHFKLAEVVRRVPAAKTQRVVAWAVARPNLLCSLVLFVVLL